MKVDPGFRALFERESPAVFRAVFLLCGDRGLAEDATQEAFARALGRWRRLSGQPWAAGWVTTTALNVARRSLRHRPAVGADTAPERADLEAHLDVRRAVAALPARQQEAVVLHYLLDLPVAEVAAAMSCDPGTVKTHLSRARRGLRVALTDPAADDEELRSGHE